MQKLSSPIDLIKKSWKIFFEKKNFLFFVKIYLPLVPFAILSLIQDKYLGHTKTSFSDALNFFGKNPPLVLVVMLIGLAYLVISFWVSVAGITAVIQVGEGKAKSIKETFDSAWKILWPFSLLSLLVGLIVVGGFILLIIPGIIFGVWYCFSSYLFIDKGLGIKESLNASKKLVVGKFWPVFGRVLVFGLFTALFEMVFSLVPFGIGSVLYSLFGALVMLPHFLLYKEISE